MKIITYISIECQFYQPSNMWLRNSGLQSIIAFFDFADCYNDNMTQNWARRSKNYPEPVMDS